jgi:prepilin-type N-terminal cleavage/methylation domain-containing protein
VKKGEQGFTLVELMVATAVTAIIIGGIGMGFYHLVAVPDYGNEKIAAVHDLQNAGHWFCKDGQVAESAVPTGGKVILTFPDASTVIYSRMGDNLVRNGDDGSMVLAQHVDDVLFTVDGRVITMEIATAPDGRWDVSANETYRACMRVDNV